jgi:hypothetical protein
MSDVYSLYTLLVSHVIRRRRRRAGNIKGYVETGYMLYTLVEVRFPASRTSLIVYCSQFLLSRLTVSLRYSQTILNTAVPGRESIFYVMLQIILLSLGPAFLSPNTTLRHIKC